MAYISLLVQKAYIYIWRSKYIKVGGKASLEPLGVIIGYLTMEKPVFQEIKRPELAKQARALSLRNAIAWNGLTSLHPNDSFDR